MVWCFIIDAPSGTCFVGVEKQRIVWLSFVGEVSLEENIIQMKKQCMLGDEDIKIYSDIFDVYCSESIVLLKDLEEFLHRPHCPKKIAVCLPKTTTLFQRRVWEALLQIPIGKTVCYQDVAKNIGQPKAVRAVASAIAKNPISFLLPCHRVLHKGGDSSNYRWGKGIKHSLIQHEQSFIAQKRKI